MVAFDCRMGGGIDGDECGAGLTGGKHLTINQSWKCWSLHRRSGKNFKLKRGSAHRMTTSAPVSIKVAMETMFPLEMTGQKYTQKLKLYINISACMS